MRGCSVFCPDEETAEYLRQSLGEPLHFQKETLRIT
jgi:hypothetical protein